MRLPRAQLYSHLQPKTPINYLLAHPLTYPTWNSGQHCSIWPDNQLPEHGKKTGASRNPIPSVGEILMISKPSYSNAKYILEPVRENF